MPRLTIACLVALLLASACSDDGGDRAAPTPTPSASESASPSPSVSPTVVATPTRGVAPPASALPTDLADGRHHAHVVAVDTARRTVTVDVLQFLTGEAAEQAAEEDGAEYNGDFYIRNQNKRLRTLSVSPGVTVVVNSLAADETGSSSQDKQVSFAKLASYYQGAKRDEARSAVFVVTLQQRFVTHLRQQYLP